MVLLKFQTLRIVLTLAALGGIAVPSAGAVERTITVARSDCELAVRYVTPPGVEYQPGVDVHGKPVVPADLYGDRSLALPESIPIVISDEQRKRFHLRYNSPLFDADAIVGIVEFHLSDRRLTFNGVELSDPEASALATLCREAARRP